MGKYRKIAHDTGRYQVCRLSVEPLKLTVVRALSLCLFTHNTATSLDRTVLSNVEQLNAPIVTTNERSALVIVSINAHEKFHRSTDQTGNRVIILDIPVTTTSNGIDRRISFVEVVVGNCG